MASVGDLGNGRAHAGKPAAADVVTLSIVTISYNQGMYLDDCLRSVYEQRRDSLPLEHIVVDAGSTDGRTQAVLDLRRSWLSCIIQEPDRGPADGLNKGFARARGTHYLYLNADDILLPGALREIEEVIRTDSRSDVWVGNGLILDKYGVARRPVYSDRWSRTGYAYGTVTSLQQATFFTARAFSKSGGFNIANRTCWDGELLIDMFLTGAVFRRLDSFLGGFRLYAESITGSGRLREAYLQDHERLFQVLMNRRSTRLDRGVALVARACKRSRTTALTASGQRS